MDKNNGGPALQKTLRDEFAMRAMQAALSIPNKDVSSRPAEIVEAIAIGSYRVADAMLKAREQ